MVVTGNEGEARDPLAEALRAWRRGEAEGFAEVYRLTFALVREIVHLRLSGRLRISAGSDDVVQDAFLALYRHPPPAEIVAGKELCAYLAAAVENRTHDLHRHEHRAKRDRDREVTPAERSAVLRRVSDAEPTPSEVSLGREAYRRYLAAVSSLADDEREAVVLARHAGLSSEESAGRLGLPSPGAFRALLSRALAKVALDMQPTRS